MSSENINSISTSDSVSGVPLAREEGGNTIPLIKWLSGIGYIAILIVLFLVWLYSDIGVGWLIGVAVVLLGALLVVMFWSKIMGLFSSRQSIDGEKLPPMITIPEAERLCENILLDKYGNKIKETIDWGTEQHGDRVKQNIFFMYIKAKFANYGKPMEYFIGLNMHYPNTHIRVIPNPSQYQIIKAKQLLSRDPEREPDVIQETHDIDPLTGRERKVLRKERNPSYQNNKQQKGDLQ